MQTKEREGFGLKNKNILQSIRCAARGMYACFREERNFRDYTVIAAVFLLLNILCTAALWEYIVFITLVSGAFSAEYINTAIERLIDSYDGEINETNKFIKDAAAAGVLAFGLAFFLSEGLILVPKLVRLLP